MKTPVVIAAYEEAAYIGQALQHLDAQTVEPVVVVNGEERHGPTARAAAECGARVIEHELQGKLPAIQAGLRSLGERALEPVLFLDADSRPLFPRRWSATMLGAMQAADTAAVVGGHRIFNDGPLLDNSYRTVRTYQDKRRMAEQHDTRAISGANMGLWLRSTHVLNKVMQLEPTWPGEDWLIADTIVEQGGSLHYADSLKGSVKTSARSNPPIKELVGIPVEERRRLFFQRYIERAAPGTQFAYIEGKLWPYSEFSLLNGMEPAMQAAEQAVV